MKLLRVWKRKRELEGWSGAKVTTLEALLYEACAKALPKKMYAHKRLSEVSGRDSHIEWVPHMDAFKFTFYFGGRVAS